MATISSHKGVQFVIFGWSAFILENLVLSHNRDQIIARFGEERYHYFYNTLSTAACTSIAYGYVKHGRKQGPKLWQVGTPAMRAAAFAFQALGFVGLSQFAPKIQFPFLLEETSHTTHTANTVPVAQISAPVVSEGGKIKARCPFDFTPADVPADGIYGIKRVTRHGLFWSLGFTGLGAALGTPFAAEVALFGGPLAVAAICGAHIDYRYRRGIGGTLSIEEERLTSHIPFAAIISGKQSLFSLASEMKQSNAVCGVFVAFLLHLKRLR